MTKRTWLFHCLMTWPLHMNIWVGLLPWCHHYARSWIWTNSYLSWSVVCVSLCSYQHCLDFLTHPQDREERVAWWETRQGSRHHNTKSWWKGHKEITRLFANKTVSCNSGALYGQNVWQKIHHGRNAVPLHGETQTPQFVHHWTKIPGQFRQKSHN